MDRIPSLVGYKLSDAKTILQGIIENSITETITPFEDKKEERKLSEPVVIRQINESNAIKLTVSFFK